ncbi:SDR family NAD(P)-dependent oxidoreductase [Kistimonas scapharcae]|uniref:SDR family NAD(P)-dependent oxidoreductase n=1 Tax=Kistimonas scapharcae TaxID=1036133 RepID=A0ABP8UZN7_9GAMM
MYKKKALPQHIWIIGGSTGIGRALALDLAQQGCRVAVSARNPDNLVQLEKASKSATGQLMGYPCDATQLQALHNNADQIFSQQGIPDVVILNAAIYDPLEPDTFSSEQEWEVMRINIHSVFNGLDMCLNYFPAPPKQILITVSPSGYRGLPGAGAYGASKAALINLAESMRPTLARRGTRLRLISPGFVDTRLTRKNRFAMPVLLTPQQASQRIIQGLRGNQFEIAFPKRLIWPLKLLSLLPASLWFKLTAELQKRDPE